MLAKYFIPEAIPLNMPTNWMTQNSPSFSCGVKNEWKHFQKQTCRSIQRTDRGGGFKQVIESGPDIPPSPLHFGEFERVDSQGRIGSLALHVRRGLAGGKGCRPTRRNLSRAPFSMYSVTIMKGLPGKRRKNPFKVSSVHRCSRGGGVMSWSQKPRTS